MRILFAATGSIAIPTLERLNEMGLIKAVLTGPDEKGGRGNKIIEPPVKIRARELGIPFYQPQTLKTEAREYVKTLDCDTLVSFCYGKIFGPKFLSLFERKYNIHPSLLPKYRGCSPLYETIKNQDRKGGISIQEIALSVDSGDILSSMSYSLDGTETLSSLEEKVALLSSDLAFSTFSNLDALHLTAQEGEVSFSRMLKKEDGEVDFSSSASSIHALIRASYPWPKAYTTYKGEKLILSSVSGSGFNLDERCSETPGSVISLDKKRGLKIATGDCYIYVDRLQAPSRKEMDAVSFVNGDKSIIGALLGR